MAGSRVTRLAPDLPAGPRAALIIGITSYQDPGLRKLRAPAHDAENLAEVLGDPGIGAFAITRVLDQDDGYVRRTIEEFLSGRGTGDLVVVYLSCHGVLDPRGRLYFAVVNTLKTKLASSGIASAWLLDQLEGCRARRQVLILDCCFSGAFARGGKGDTDLHLERRLAVQGRGHAVLTASRASEYSFEGEALPGVTVAGSVFTAGLVDGLRTGAADVGGDGYVSLDEAYDHAYEYVLRTGANQTPQRWLSGGEGSIMLARSTAGLVITPAPLPEALAGSLILPYPLVRIGAVNAVGEWLSSADPAQVLTAEQTLQRIADNDIPAVAAAARAHLASVESADMTHDPSQDISPAPKPSRKQTSRSTPSSHRKALMGRERGEPAGDWGLSAESPPKLLAVLRMDLMDSEAAVRRNELAFLRRMALIRESLKGYLSRVGENSGEGDSIRQAFADPSDALKCAFHLRHGAGQPIDGADGLYTLAPRVILHFDRFTEDTDGRIEGRGQILITRLDHLVPPGEIWATEAFVDVTQHIGADKGYIFEYMGQLDLEKNSGKYSCYAVAIDSEGTSRGSQRSADPVGLAMRQFHRGDKFGAIEALGAIELESASRLLADIALDPTTDRSVRHAALTKLRERGYGIPITPIFDAFHEGNFDAETQALLLLVLGANGSEDVFSILKNIVLTKTTDSRLREAALLAMRSFRGSLTAEVVEITLDDPDDAIRIAACVVAESGRMTSLAQTKLHKIVVDADLPMDLRAVACEALSSQPITRQLTIMLGELAHDQDCPLTLRRYAIDGLARSDSPIALRMVRGIAQQAEDDLHNYAADTLGAMQRRYTVDSPASENPSRALSGPF